MWKMPVGLNRESDKHNGGNRLKPCGLVSQIAVHGPVVLLQCAGKLVGAGLAGDKLEVIGAGRIKRRPDCAAAGIADRPWRQAPLKVGIIGRRALDVSL